MVHIGIKQSTTKNNDYMNINGKSVRSHHTNARSSGHIQRAYHNMYSI